LVTPLFILGKQRSGTTWLANQLCRHPDIAGIQHQRHFGIHESAYFSSVMGRYGSLKVPENFVEFVKVMAGSDYFRLAGVSEEFLLSMWTTGYAEIFRAVMNHFAEKSGAKYWLEKTPAHTPLVDTLANIYPDALFIGIFRNPQEVAASSLKLETNENPNTVNSKFKRKLFISRNILSLSYYNKKLKSFQKRSDRIYTVEYKEMKFDLEKTLHHICQHLGLPWNDAVLGQSYKPNTGFKEKSERKALITNSEKRMIAILTLLGKSTPLIAYEAMNRIKKSFNSRRSLPEAFFRLTNLEQEQS